jgi:archaellum biogenesis ATPase FlaH
MSAAEKTTPTAEEIERYRDVAKNSRDGREKMDAWAWLTTHDPDQQTPEPEPEKPPQAYAPGNPSLRYIARQRQERARKLVPVGGCLADLTRQEYTWLWPGRIPDNRISIIQGEKGCGKSTLWGSMAATVTTGGTWPEGTKAQLGSVVFVQSEEIMAVDILPRIDAHGGDLNKVHFYIGGKYEGADDSEAHFSLASGVDVLEEFIDAIGDVRLLVIDPLGEFIEEMSGNTETDVRRLLRPIRIFAERKGIAVVLMAHLNKDENQSITSRLMGSAAFAAIARMLWNLGEDPADSSRRCLSLVKGNAADKIATGLAFGMEGERLVWYREPVRLSARQVDRILQDQRLSEGRQFGTERAPYGPPPTKTFQAAEKILASLGSRERTQTELRIELVRRGISKTLFTEALQHLAELGAEHRARVASAGPVRHFSERDPREPFVARRTRKVVPVRSEAPPADSTGKDGGSRKGGRTNVFWLRACGLPRLPDVTIADPLDAWGDDGGAVD